MTTSNPLIIVDSHCHLNFKELSSQLEEVMQRAKSHDVHYMLTVNTKLEETQEIIDIAYRFPHVFASVGVHPCDVAAHLAFSSDLKQKLCEWASLESKIVAFGETGLDYYYDESLKDLQHLFFETHLEAGVELNLPVIIHTRNADEDTLAIISHHPNAKGVFHCFSGDIEFARKALEAGYYISFSGIITFKNATALRDVVSYVPLDRILVETDSPYLAPVPFRGKSNEPAFTKYVAEQIALVKDIPLADVAAATTSNFFHLFSKINRF